MQGGQTVVAFHIDVGTVVNLGAEIGAILLDSYQKIKHKNIWTIIEKLFQPVFEELVGGCVWQHSGEATPASKSHFYFLSTESKNISKVNSLSIEGRIWALITIQQRPCFRRED